MRAELKRLHHRLGNTIVFVTHDQLEAMTMSTYIAVMNEGRLQQFAPPMEVSCRPANLFVAEFVGNPPMNLFHLEDAVTGPIARSILAALPASGGGACTVGVRPEALVVLPAGRPFARGWSEDAVVETLLPTGSEWIVGLRVHEAMVFARVVDEPRYAMNDPVAIAAESSAFHLFDHTGNRTASGDAGPC